MIKRALDLPRFSCFHFFLFLLPSRQFVLIYAWASSSLCYCRILLWANVKNVRTRNTHSWVWITFAWSKALSSRVVHGIRPMTQNRDASCEFLIGYFWQLYYIRRFRVIVAANDIILTSVTILSHLADPVDISRWEHFRHCVLIFPRFFVRELRGLFLADSTTRITKTLVDSVALLVYRVKKSTNKQTNWETFLHWNIL